jgi:hypothetical protein
MEVRRDPEGTTSRTTGEKGASARRLEWEERDRSVTDLVGDLTSQVAHLARVEAQLAAREVTDKAKRGAMGGGLFAAAGIVALYGGGALVAAAVFALWLVWPGWLSALVVGVLLLAFAGTLAMVGRSKLRNAMPPVPDETMEGARKDVRAMSGRMEQ